ncbi:MAG: alpha/beta fold hydrolase [Chloroflexota bacterium]
MDSRTIETAYGPVHAQTAGTGPAAIFLHGRHPPLNNWRVWEANLNAVVSSGFRAVALELPGYGDLARPEGGISTESAVDCVLDLFDRLAISRTTIVGHHWGGLLAWRAALIDSKRITQLVLVAPEGGEQIGDTLPGKLLLPTLILWANGDPYFSAVHAAAFASAIPNSIQHIFEASAGQPDNARQAPQLLGAQFNEVLIPFLKEG